MQILCVLFNEEIYLDSLSKIFVEFGYAVAAVNLDKFFAIKTKDDFNNYKNYSLFKIFRNFGSKFE